MADGASVTKCQGEATVLGCGFRQPPFAADDITLSDTSGSTPVTLGLIPGGDDPIFTILSHTLPASEATGVKSYQCTASSLSLSEEVDVAIHFIEQTGKIL